MTARIAVKKEAKIEETGATIRVPEEKKKNPVVAVDLDKAAKEDPKPKVVEPKFENLVLELAEADRATRDASANAANARTERSTVATAAIKAAFAEKIKPEDVRKQLLGEGVLKGTVSKIVTILNALNSKVLTPNDIKSLNGGYQSVRDIEKATLAALAGTPGAATPTPAPVKIATTPDAALDIIIANILAEKDPDKVFALAGDWIAKCTNAITEALKTIEDED